MTPAVVPDWAAWAIIAVVIAGSALSLLGAIGLFRLGSFYERVHAPTLGATLGTVLILTGAWIYFGAAHGRWAPRELLIVAFLTATTPVTLILLARAALFRDRTEASEPTEKPVPPGAEGHGD